MKAFTSSFPEEQKKSRSTDFAHRGDYPFPGERHATLAHATAVSDAQGIARFTQLTVTGTSDSVVYISFFANGKLLSWSNPSSSNSELENPSFKAPWFVHPRSSDNTTVELLTLPSAEVSEGRPFDRQPVVQVSPARAGRIVYAIVVAKDGVARPGRATSPFGKPEIAIKRLVNAKAVTSASGVARFDNLGFQAGGNAGSYHIEFWCEGKRFDREGAVPVNVISSISRVQVDGQFRLSCALC